MSVLRFILSGLWLPFRLYLQPFQFRQEIAALTPDLPPNYGLWRSRWHLCLTRFRHSLYMLVLQSAIALYWVPLCLYALEALGYSVDWAEALKGIVYGASLFVLSDMVADIALSLTIGVVQGVTLGVGAAMAFGMGSSVAFGITVGIVNGVASGVTLFVIFGLTAGFSFLVEDDVNRSMAYSLAGILAISHLPNLVLQLPSSLLAWPLHRFWPRTSRRLWHIHPVHWDDIILLPLPGLPSLLATLYRLDSTAGQQALKETAAHKFQYRAAYRAWAMLAQEQALGIASLPGLAQFAASLDWLNEDTPLPESLRGLLLRLRDISREAGAAEESDSATNQLRRLEAARAQLETLGKQQTGGFGPAIQHWTGLVEAGLAQARRR